MAEVQERIGELSGPGDATPGQRHVLSRLWAYDHLHDVGSSQFGWIGGHVEPLVDLPHVLFCKCSLLET